MKTEEEIRNLLEKAIQQRYAFEEERIKLEKHIRDTPGISLRERTWKREHRWMTEQIQWLYTVDNVLSSILETKSTYLLRLLVEGFPPAAWREGRIT